MKGPDRDGNKFFTLFANEYEERRVCARRELGIMLPLDNFTENKRLINSKYENQKLKICSEWKSSSYMKYLQKNMLKNNDTLNNDGMQNQIQFSLMRFLM